MRLKNGLRSALVFGCWIASITTAAAAGTEKFFENSSSNDALLNLLNHTVQSLDIEIYEIKDTRVHAAIRAALDRGVKVRIVQESLTAAPTCKIFEPKNPGDPEDCLLRKNLVADVRAKGGVYVPFDFSLCGQTANARGACFQHGKIVLSDARFALISTGNFNPSNLCDKAHTDTCNRDYSVLTWDPGTVLSLRQVFEMDLRSRPYDLEKLLAQPAAAKLTVSPLSLKPLVAFIRSAKQMIQVQNQYLNDPTLNAALIEAAQRGVKVYVNVASFCSFDKPTPGTGDWNRVTQTYTAFDQAGIQTRIFDRKMAVGGMPGYLHAKAILVDSARAWVGSINGSVMSTSRNREFGIFLDDSAEALKLGAFLKADFRNPDGETWQESLRCKNDVMSVFGRGSERAARIGDFTVY